MTALVGILNLTPDSFSGDGTLLPGEALARIEGMIRDGASIIDIGAESTRPNAQALAPEEEWRRLAPLAEAIRTFKGKAVFSIDTRHADVARKALGSGFGIINDVSGAGDPAMLSLARETGCRIVLMHSLGVPVVPSQTLPEGDNPVMAVLAWAKEMLARTRREGLDRWQVILDPGIGFGKTPEQSLALIGNIARLKALGAAVLVGHSRKSFLSLFTDRPAGERDPETLAVSYYLAAQGVDYLRVHDVKSHAAMLRIREAL